MNRLSLPLLLPVLAAAPILARAQSVWSGAVDSTWSNTANWDAPPAGGPLSFPGPGPNPPTQNDLPSLSVGGITFGASLSGPVTLDGNALTLTGGVTNLNTVAGREVSINLPLHLPVAQSWTVANDPDAITFINGNLSGAGNLVLAGARASNGVTPPVLQMAGNNAAYTGAISTPGADSFGLMMLSPSAQTGGLVDLSLGNRNLWLAANSAANAYTFWTGNTTPATGEPMRVNFRNAGTSGLFLSGGDAHWNPVTTGTHYEWDSGRAGANGEIRFNGSNDTAAAPAIGAQRMWFFGNDTGSLVLGGNRVISNGGGGGGPGRVTLRFALSDDGTARQLTTGANPLILTRPAGGGPATPSLAGATVVNGGALAVSDMAQLFNGWLNLSAGVLLLDGVNWSQFMADRAAGYRASAAPDTWGISGSGGGFAARSAPLVVHVDDVPGNSYGTITAGAVFNRDFTLGSAARDADGSLYANQPVRITQSTVLTGARVIRVAGGNQEQRTHWILDGPVHEIAGALSGAFPLTIGGTSGTAGGTLRLSNTNNTFSALSVNPAGQGGGVVVLATDDAALGSGTVTVGSGNQGQAGMLLFENPGIAPKTFTRSLTVALGLDASSGDSGFGSWAGEVVHAGTVTVTGDRTTLPVHVHSGRLSFTGASLANNSTGGAFSYHKGGAGEIDLGDLAHTGTQANWRWVLYQGTLTSHSATQPRSATVPLRAADLLGFNSAYTGAPNFPRVWRVRGADHFFTGVDATGGYAPGGTVDVATGLILSMDFGAAAFTPMEGFGQQVTTPAWKLVKTGGGAWVMTNSRTDVGFGPVNGAGFIEVREGTLDLTGNYGRGSVRLLDGATLLSGVHSPFTYGTGAGFQLGVGQIGLLEIQGTGGRIGISPLAGGNVSRAAGLAWTQQPGARLALAARDNLDLIFANASFPDVASGSELRVERDGTGGGLVLLRDAAITVDGTLSGSGVLSTGVAGAGMVTVNGAVTPGAGGPGTLGTGHLTIGSTGSLDLDFNGLVPGGGHDRLDITGSLTLQPGAQLNPTFGFAPPTGTVFTVVSNDGSDPVSGAFSHGANELSEGESITAGSVTMIVSYVGGDGNDVTLAVTSVSPTGYAVWIQGFGLPAADQDELDDPDHDGMPNLLEYFSALTPATANPPMCNALDAAGGALRFTFRRGLNRPDLSHAFEWSTDMVAWHPADASHVFTEAVVGGDASHDLVRATLAVPSGTPRMHARVRVDRR